MNEISISNFNFLHQSAKGDITMALVKMQTDGSSARLTSNATSYW